MRTRKTSKSLSSSRSPRSARTLAAWKRCSTSASEMFRMMAALISWPAPLATEMTWSSSPCHLPIEERTKG